MKLMIALTLAIFASSAISATPQKEEILLTKNNVVNLRGPVNSQSVNEVIAELTELDKLPEAGPIFLVLNTPGGSVSAGLELIQYINTLRRPVSVVANFAASMGFHILQHSKTRFITEFGTIMSHRASGSFQGEIPHQINSRLKHVADLVGKMDDHVISRTNGKYTKSSYMELIRDEYYGVGSNGIQDRFADKIAVLKCDSELKETKVKKQIQVFFFKLDVEMSKCPLITEVKLAKETKEDQKELLIKHFTSITNYQE